MSGVEVTFGVLTIVFGGGLVALLLVRRQAKKLGAETTKLEVDTAIALTDAADDHLVGIVTAQTEGLVKPLLEQVQGYRDEVKVLREEVATLREQVRNISHLYRLILGWARTVVAWAAKHPDLDPPLPPLPPEIADEL